MHIQSFRSPAFQPLSKLPTQGSQGDPQDTFEAGHSVRNTLADSAMLAGFALGGAGGAVIFAGATQQGSRLISEALQHGFSASTLAGASAQTYLACAAGAVVGSLIGATMCIPISAAIQGK